MKFSVRLLYLYLFSFIGLLIAVIGSIRLIQLGIKVYIFKGADIFTSYPMPVTVSPDGKIPVIAQRDNDLQQKIQNEENKRRREREVSEAVAMLIIGIPLYKYHWNIIQKEGKKSKLV